ncbi:Uncharacterised protein [Niallia circulans]|nr:hypothetical protein [Niallia circulans]MED3840549.1 hypothetical protein [Niallia circulans]MED4243553.1 hypothetical protein [Niallia circulans]MED4247422.1 hypothetical protein [Niallia circulans]SPT85591.1 Uncharacterised protein [Niallia circulans]
MEVNQRLEQTNSFFSTQATLPLSFRIRAAGKIKKCYFRKRTSSYKGTTERLGKASF